MLKRIRDYFCGYRFITIGREDSAECADILLHNNLSFVHHGRTAGGDVIIRIREKEAGHFRFLAEEKGINLSVSEDYGVRVHLRFLKKRPMLLIGCILAAVWIMYSSHIVWDIRIKGNTKTPDEEIIAVLDSIGFSVGTYYPSVDLEEISEKYAAVQQDIAWLSVYMHNAVAEVEVRELYRDEREKHPSSVYANITAGSSGIIEEVNVFEGQAAVKPGDFVVPGQVLISGVIDIKNGGVHYEYASGEVIARVSVPLSAEVKTERERCLPTGNEKHEISIKFFKNKINFFQKGGIVYASYDKISRMEQLCLFDSIYLPVWIEDTVYTETVSRTESLSADDAAAEALDEFDEKLRAEIRNAELIGREISAGFADGVYRIDCILTLRRDIGKTSEFTVNGYPAEVEKQ